jgi:hypothetical protein
MTMQVDVLSVKRFWDREIGRTRFHFSVDWGGLEPSDEDLRARSEETSARLAGSGNPTTANGWVLTDKGWSGVMVGYRGLDDVLEWLEELASTWPAKIVGGPRSQDWTAVTLTDPGLLTCLMLEVPDMTHLPRDEREIGWKVDEATTRYLAERGLAWTHVRRSQHLFWRGTWRLRQPGLDHATALAEGARVFDSSADMSATDTLVLREFELSGVGGAFFVSGPEKDWRACFDRHRDVLTWTPPRTLYAYVRHSKFVPRDSGASWPHFPAISEGHFRYHRPLLARYVPDAFGIQVLTDAHLERAHDLTDWDITPLANGRHLVAAKDVEGWFGTLAPRDWRVVGTVPPLPDNRDLVEKARADFGEMILTPDTLEREMPWPNWPQ